MLGTMGPFLYDVMQKGGKGVSILMTPENMDLQWGSE